MKLSFFFVCFLIFSNSYAQTPKDNIKQSSIIEIKGNQNTVRVVQDDKVTIYNLNDKKESEEFLQYLRTIPLLNNEIKKLLNNSELSLKLLKNIYKGQVLDARQFTDIIGGYIAENLKLRQENEKLKNSTPDPDFAKVLEFANKELENYNNEAYQQILNDFKVKVRKKYESELAQVCYLQSINNMSNYRNNDAIEQINEALRYQEDNFDFLTLKGHLLMNIFDYSSSRKAYLKILEISKNDTLNIDTYNHLGLTYYGDGLYDKAMDYFKLSIEKDRQLHKQPYFPSPYNNIGLLFFNRGRGKEALDYFNVGLSLEKKIKQTDSAAISNTYNSIGLCHHSMGNDKEALENFDLSLTYRKKELSKYNPFVAMVYNNIAMVYISSKDFKKASEYIKKAITIMNKLSLQYSFLTSSLYINSGLISQGLGDNVTAEHDFRTSIEVNKLIHGPDHPEVAKAYYTLGCFFHEIGYNSIAVLYCDSALTIQKNKFDASDQVLGNTYEELAYSYFYMRFRDTVSIAKGIPDFLAALDIQRKSLSPNELHAATICYFLGMSYENLRNNELSLVYFSNAAALYEKILGLNNQQTVEANWAVGFIYIKNGDKKKGLAYLVKAGLNTEPDSIKAIAINDEAKKEDHRNYPSQTLNILKLAVEFLEKSRANNETAIEIYYNLANSFYGMHQKEKALPYYKKALMAATILKQDGSYLKEMLEKCQDKNVGKN
jgi:tetratricopeptide (TPR) repeat protein